MGYCKPFKRGVSWRSQNFGANATIYGPHSGNDDAAPIGTPVHAAGDGYIEWAGEFDDSYQDNLLWLLKMGGNIAVLNCGANAPSFVYGHMDSFTVKRGDWVRKGQVIGYSGNTGTATTGAHLHTEAIPPGYSLNSSMLGRVNPDIYLTEWPEDINVGSLSYASESITHLEEDDFMATPEDRAKLIQELLDHKIPQAGGGTVTLGERLAEGRGQHADTIRVIEGIPDALLDRRRGSTLGEMVNEYRGQHLQLVGLLQGIETDGVIDPAAIAAAIPDGIAQAVADEIAKRLGA
jgi:murein DD-endopeptidase MepM/ murein hydrolase activator NlpD